MLQPACSHADLKHVPSNDLQKKILHFAQQVAAGLQTHAAAAGQMCFIQQALWLQAKGTLA